jgi:alpha-L-fucosidase
MPVPEPTPARKVWMDFKFGMFIHFSLNTFIDKEWGDGTHNPQVYDPKELDTDQWCETSQKAA